MGYFDDIITKETQDERDSKRRQVQWACGEIYGLLIPQLIVSIASRLLNKVPVVGLLLSIASIVIGVIYAVKLFNIGKRMSDDIKAAAIFNIIAVALPLLSAVGSILLFSINPYGPNDMYIAAALVEIVISVISFILEIIALYKETDGFYTLINKFNPTVAEYFKKTFTYFLIATIVLIIGTVIGAVAPFLGLVVMVVALVLSIIAYVNKFKAYSYGSGFSDVMGD